MAQLCFVLCAWCCVDRFAAINSQVAIAEIDAGTFYDGPDDVCRFCNKDSHVVPVTIRPPINNTKSKDRQQQGLAVSSWSSREGNRFCTLRLRQRNGKCYTIDGCHRSAIQRYCLASC